MKQALRRGGFGLLAAGALAGCAQGGLAGLPSDQQAEARRVEAYFASLGLMRAHVVQSWPDGTASTGALDYAPGMMRVDYGPPRPMQMVAAHGHIAVQDGASGSLTRLSLARNPLGLLLRTPVRFDRGIAVTSVQHGPGWLQISVSEADNPSQGRLTLQFSDVGGVLALAGLDGVDARGHELVLHVTNWTKVQGFEADTFNDPR